MRKLFLAVLVCAVISCTIAACAPTQAPAETEDETIKVGGVFCLTGDQASCDFPAMRSFMLAAKEINAKGGINGKQIEVIVEDGKTDQAATANAVEKLITVDKVPIIGGLNDTTYVLAAGPVAQEHSIPFVECGASMPELPDQVGDCLYMACFGDNVQAYAGAQFAYDELGARTAWIFIDTACDYSVALATYFKERFEELSGDGSVILEDTYQTTDVDFSSQISRLKSLDPQPDVLMICAEVSKAGLITKQVRQMGVTVPILGGDGFDTPLTLDFAGNYEDVYFTTHVTLGSESDIVKHYIAAYKEEYGVEPESGFAALGYDAMYLIADALTRADSLEPNAIKEALSSTRGLKGVTGSITFTKESRIPQKPVTIMKIDNGEFKFIKEV